MRVFFHLLYLRVHVGVVTWLIFREELHGMLRFVISLRLTRCFSVFSFFQLFHFSLFSVSRACEISHYTLKYTIGKPVFRSIALLAEVFSYFDFSRWCCLIDIILLFLNLFPMIFPISRRYVSHGVSSLFQLFIAEK